MKLLYHKLRDEIAENKQLIQEIINKFEEEKSEYKQISINENIHLVLRTEGNDQLMMIGFPFPLESYPITDFKTRNKISIHIFLRGETIRSYQRMELLHKIKSHNKVTYQEVVSVKKFREITKNLFRKYKKLDYYDPYSFIGDSFIGLHFIDNCLQTFHTKLSIIYSENYRNLENVAKTRGYMGNISVKKDVLNIFADLLDNHWSRTKYLVDILTKQKSPAVIIGRDLIIIPEADQVYIYHFNRANILLKSQNIEDYMNDCLMPFLQPLENAFDVRATKSFNIIINPFGSERIKAIPQDIILNVCKHFNNSYLGSRIIIISGFKYTYYHILYISQLKGLLSQNNLHNVAFKNYGTFDEIETDINKYDMALGITTDSSLSHFFNYIGLRNLTFFNLERCDLTSPQSLASDSPLGFCRYGNVQYPALVYKKDNADLIKGTIGFIDYFLEKSKSQEWCRLLFNKKYLISRINPNINELIRSNKKIDPECKLKNA